MSGVAPTAVEALAKTHAYETSRLYQLRQEVLAAHPNLSDEDPDLDEMLRNETRLDDVEGEGRLLVLRLARHAKLRKSYAKACAEEKKLLDEKRQAHEKAEERARDLITKICEAMSFDDGVKDGVVSIFFREPNQQEVYEIDDVHLLPKAFVKKEIVYKPDIEKIKAHYAAGGDGKKRKPIKGVRAVKKSKVLNIR